jgi:hypothetical protein
MFALHVWRCEITRNRDGERTKQKGAKLTGSKAALCHVHGYVFLIVTYGTSAAELVRQGSTSNFQLLAQVMGGHREIVVSIPARGVPGIGHPPRFARRNKKVASRAGSDLFGV